MSSTKESRRSELLALSKRDPKAALQIWRDAGGVPPGGKFEADVDFEHVIVPAILEMEFERGQSPSKLEKPKT